METLDKNYLTDNYYDLGEAAEILGVTLTTMRGYVTKGKIPANKIGGKWQIQKEEIKKHIGILSTSSPQPIPTNSDNQKITELLDTKITAIIRQEIKKLLEEERENFFNDLKKYLANYRCSEDSEEVIARFVLKLILQSRQP